MRLGIVGSEAAKFTNETEAKAREIIRSLLHSNITVVSGACHLGGIDIWAKEEAYRYGIPFLEFPPEYRTWEYYKKRNLQIVRNSDRVVCITVAKLPDSYKGMKFDFCYHCKTDSHIKSGGCWTVKKAVEAGKEGTIIVVY